MLVKWVISARENDLREGGSSVITLLDWNVEKVKHTDRRKATTINFE